MIRSCPHCGSRNRIPSRHLSDQGRCGQCRETLPPQSTPIDVDAAQFDDIIRSARVPVLIDFWAAWCGPCKMAAPEVAKAAASMTGKALFLKVDTERCPDLAGRYNVRGIPNFALFKDGELKWQQAGLLRQSQIEDVVRQFA